jgi:hypothetical protein
MSPAHGSRPRSTALVAAVVAATLALLLLTGNPALALAPLVVTLFVWALLELPLNRLAIAVFFIAIVVDNPKEHPAEDLWDSPLKPLGVFLYENLNNITGISALRFSMTDVLLASLVVAAAVRGQRRGATAAPPGLHLVLAAAFVAIVWLELWGLARGGDFKASLWQMRPLFWAPAIAYVFTSAIRGPSDHLAVGKAVVLAALIKASFGVYFYVIVCRPMGYWPAYATTHSDTVLFTTAAMIALAYWLEHLTLRSALMALGVLLVVGLGVIVNGRRLAYISLASSFAAIYLVLPSGRLTRTANRALALAGPPAAVYLALGWSSESSIFGPARKVASLFSKEDRSSAMRDIENYNLILTWKKHLLLGSGFGHPYDEMTSPDGINAIFPLYRYIGHNSILWLEAAGGVVAFGAFWSLLVALAYLAARSYRFAHGPTDRAAALVALSVVVIFGVQAHGDMGLNSWTSMFCLGMSLAVAAKLAVASGAFPARSTMTLAAPRPALVG